MVCGIEQCGSLCTVHWNWSGLPLELCNIMVILWIWLWYREQSIFIVNEWQPHPWQLLQLTVRADSPFRIMPQVLLSPRADSDCIHQLVLTTPRLPIDSKLYGSSNTAQLTHTPEQFWSHFQQIWNKEKKCPHKEGKNDHLKGQKCS